MGPAIPRNFPAGTEQEKLDAGQKDQCDRENLPLDDPPEIFPVFTRPWAEVSGFRSRYISMGAVALLATSLSWGK
jgi:hypothetical protein